MLPETVFGVRHLEDEHWLYSAGFDAPLKVNQQKPAQQIVDKMIAAKKPARVKIVHSRFNRSVQTAQLLKESFGFRRWFDVELSYEAGLDEIDQGRPKFPEGFRDGDNLPFLNQAWSEFCVQTYEHNRTDYKYGSGSFTEVFDSPGESLLDVLPRQYDFFERLIDGKVEAGFDFVVLCCHSTSLQIIAEFNYLALFMEYGLIADFEASELPKRCWQIFEGAKVNGFFPKVIGFGQIFEFDLMPLRNSSLAVKIAAAKRHYSGEH